MMIKDLIDTAQRYTMYADWVPIVNWYSPIARAPLAITQLATGALKDGTLNLCRAGVFYYWVKDRTYKEISITNVVAGLFGSAWFIGFDMARMNTTAEHLLSLGLPNPFKGVDAMVRFANRFCLIPFVSSVTSFPARLLAGGIQAYAASSYATASKLGMVIAKLLGDNEALEIAKANFRFGTSLALAGNLNISRSIFELIPFAGNFAVWGLE